MPVKNIAMRKNLYKRACVGVSRLNKKNSKKQPLTISQYLRTAIMSFNKTTNVIWLSDRIPKDKQKSGEDWRRITIRFQPDQTQFIYMQLAIINARRKGTPVRFSSYCATAINEYLNLDKIPW